MGQQGTYMMPVTVTVTVSFFLFLFFVEGDFFFVLFLV